VRPFISRREVEALEGIFESCTTLVLISDKQLTFFIADWVVYPNIAIELFQHFLANAQT
jgi:hypothetical protein